MIALYLVIIICMRVVQSFYSKKANLELPGSMYAYIKYIMISKFLAAGFALVSLIIAGDFGGFNLQGLLIATFSGIFLAISSWLQIEALKGGTMVLSSIFSTAGLIVPCLLGIFVFDEPMNYIQFICIFVFFAASVLIVDSSKKIYGHFSPKMLIYLLGGLVSNGMTMFCQKLFGELQPDGNVSMFSLMTFLIPSVILFLGLKPIEATGEKKEPLSKNIILYALFLAFAVFIVQQFVTILTPMLSSAVLFTFVMGGATVVTVIVGAIVYKEKVSFKCVAGVVICLLSMLLIKIFE